MPLFGKFELKSLERGLGKNLSSERFSPVNEELNVSSDWYTQ